MWRKSGQLMRRLRGSAHSCGFRQGLDDCTGIIRHAVAGSAAVHDTEDRLAGAAHCGGSAACEEADGAQGAHGAPRRHAPAQLTSSASSLPAAASPPRIAARGAQQRSAKLEVHDFEVDLN